MEENEKEESGISIGEIFRVIFSQKFLALAILVVVAMAIAVGLYFGKNKKDMQYEVSFTLELPNTGNIKDSSATVVYYPDGTPFYYTDIVALQTLQKVKNSNAAFEGLDVEKMSKNGDISIARDISETANNSGTYETFYRISVKARYFSDKDVARDYVIALTRTPIDYLGLMDVDYNVYLGSARTSPDYVSEINLLISQAQYLVERYDNYISAYGDLSIDGKTLRVYRQDIYSYLNDIGDLDYLLAMVRKEGFLKSEELKERYDVELSRLERQLEIAKFTLDNLLKVQGDSESVSSAAIIKEQSDLVAELQQEISEIRLTYSESIYCGDNVPKVFTNGLNEAYEKMESYTKTLEEVSAKLYDKVAVVSYSDSNIISTSGTSGLLNILLISLVCGIVVALVVAYAVGWNVNRKKKLKACENSKNSGEQNQPADNN